MCGVDPLDLVETIREGVLDAGLTVLFAHRTCGDTFAVIRKDAPRDKEGRQ